MSKRFFVAIIGLLVVVGMLAGIKFLQIRKMIAQGSHFSPPPEIVTTAEVGLESWESTLTAIGSLEAVQGVTITAELSGRVVDIGFEPGSMVRAGDLLVKLDTSTEEAQLRSVEASVTLAGINFKRIKKLYATKSVSQSDYDKDEAAYRVALAEADAIRATIAKKTIRAPFAGRLGVRLINLGQVLNEGQAVVSLQSLDPIFVNFQLPQQQLPLVKTGLTVRLTLDESDNGTSEGKPIEGKITTINPEVDATSRNFLVQATVANSDERLRPGMFTDVAVVLPQKKKVLAIPATSVLYAPYGDSVFLVEEKKDEATGKTGKVLRQQFVRLGEKRGDYVAVSAGLKAGETVVTTGAFKLRNGQAAVVDNTLSPKFKLNPTPPNT